MPIAKVAMHKIKEVLRLKYVAQLSQRQIAGALGLSNGVVAKYLTAASASGVAYSQLAALDDEALARALAGDLVAQRRTGRLPLPSQVWITLAFPSLLRLSVRCQTA